MHHGPIDQTVHIRDAPAVAAQQPMVAEDPQIARLRDRLVRRRRDVVGIGRADLETRLQQFADLASVKPSPPRSMSSAFSSASSRRAGRQSKWKLGLC
jgi:hypothetical protein